MTGGIAASGWRLEGDVRALWFAADATRTASVSDLLPRGYDSYLRVTSVEHWVDVPEDAMLPSLWSLRDVLSAHTTTPEIVWCGLWQGQGAVSHEVLNAASTQLPDGLEMALATGPLSSLRAFSVAASDVDLPVTPTLLWPQDRAWVLNLEHESYDAYLACTLAASRQVQESDVRFDHTSMNFDDSIVF